MEITPINSEIPPLRFASLAPDVWKALGELKRTGWINRGVVNPESVSEHIISLRNTAFKTSGLSEMEKEGLLDMLEVHDWPEAIHGDEVILSYDEEELKSLKATKFEKELIALTLICEKLGEKGKEIMDLWLRFEKGNDPASIFAKQLDKYQAIEKALEYEKAQEIPLFMEFLNYSRKNITHPALALKIKELEKEYVDFKLSKNLEKFKEFKDKAIDKCKKLSFAEKSEGLWSNPEIVEYFTKIEPEESVNCLVSSLSHLNLSGKKILCIGGGTGSIGRRILELFPDFYVTEIDSSEEMVSMANNIAREKGLSDRFISIKADARFLPFKENEYDYAISYGVFRYIDQIDQDQVIDEMERVSDNNFTIAESILGELIYSLNTKIKKGKSDVVETQINMNRVSLFYMLFKEYKEDAEFMKMVDAEIADGIDFIDILKNIAGVSKGVLYELRVSSI